MTAKLPRQPAIASIHLDAVGGAAGDMFVACMLDAFPELIGSVLEQIVAILPKGAGRPLLEEGSSGGIRAMRFGLEASEPESHSTAHGHQGVAAEAMFPAMVRLIESAAIGEETKRHAVAILTRLAEAEAHIHCVPIDQVHFHEIADWDSLMDVVAAGAIIAALGSVQWSVSALPMGAGLVKTQHGLLPVPAPATTQLLHGFTLRDDGVPGERVTPTGAAILAHLVDPSNQIAPRATGTLIKTGIGAGTRHMKGLPNILRALVFVHSDDADRDDVDVIEFEVDDMTGEEIGIALDRLRKTSGVLDATTALRMGKKGRPMTEFRLLCTQGNGHAVAEACFHQTSTIGLRIRSETRLVLPREQSIAGDTRFKAVKRPNGNLTRKAESDDLERLDTLFDRRRAAALLEHER